MDEDGAPAIPEAGEKYVQLIHRAHDEGTGVVNLDTLDVRKADPVLYKWLAAYPHEVLPIFDLQVRRKGGNPSLKQILVGGGVGGCVDFDVNRDSLGSHV